MRREIGAVAKMYCISYETRGQRAKSRCHHDAAHEWAKQSCNPKGRTYPKLVPPTALHIALYTRMSQHCSISVSESVPQGLCIRTKQDCQDNIDRVGDSISKRTSRVEVEAKVDDTTVSDPGLIRF